MPGPEAHRSVARALQALELAVASQEGLTLGELAERLEVPKSSLHPLLRTLAGRGYLTVDGARYRSGTAIATLAAADRPPLVALARPLMEALVGTLDETVMLGSMVGETLVYLHTVESHQLVRYSPPRVRPATARPSSIGKLYLAELDNPALERELEAYADEDYRRQLHDEVVAARASGLAFNHGDTFPDLSAVAARIGTSSGIVACLAVGGPSRRVEARSEEIAAALLDAVGQVERGLR